MYRMYRRYRRRYLDGKNQMLYPEGSDVFPCDLIHSGGCPACLLCLPACLECLVLPGRRRSGPGKLGGGVG